MKCDPREHGQNLFPLPVFTGSAHTYVFVFMCVGTDDGAQEVVKEILEDVVTSAVKGKNPALPSTSFLQKVLSQTL